MGIKKERLTNVEAVDTFDNMKKLIFDPECGSFFVDSNGSSTHGHIEMRNEGFAAPNDGSPEKHDDDFDKLLDDFINERLKEMDAE